MKEKKKNPVILILIVLTALAIAVVSILDHEAGKGIGNYFLGNLKTMVTILPLALILISLFEVWVHREKVERLMGEKGGAISYLLAILLGGLTIGPMIVSLPMSAALYKKGARLSIIFTYLGASAVCRIPMTIFEASYLGVKFTIIRYCVSIPLIILTSLIMGRILQKRQFVIEES